MKFFVHWLTTIIALIVAYIVLSPYGWMSIEGASAVLAFAVMGIVIGLLNTFIRPVLKFLSCAFIILTVGLFMLVINAAVLWLSSWISQQIGIGLVVTWWQGVVLGSIIISVVSFIINLFIHDRRRK
jgi:putative membrane protein